jgi:CubicO group peptidase (beta-lactamase class C family)
MGAMTVHPNRRSVFVSERVNRILGMIALAAILPARAATPEPVASVPSPPPVVAAPPVTAPLTTTDAEEFVGPFVREHLVRRRIAGDVVVIVKGGDVLLSRGYGFADLEHRIAMTPDRTLVRPGSISKLFTAIAVIQLVEQGKLDLDRNVDDYLDVKVPTPRGGEPVTLRMLLTHHAGFEMHVKDLFGPGTRPEPVGRWLRHSLPPRIYPAGDVAAYSNYGHGLAGYIVDRASGIRFEEYAAAHILAPLPMTRSTFGQPVSASVAPAVARAYRRSTEPPIRYFETVVPAPAGGLSATAADMGRFMLALLGGGSLDGEHILRALTLFQMMSSDSAGDGLH